MEPTTTKASNRYGSLARFVRMDPIKHFYYYLL
jgi:hypothetical protein